MIFGNLDVRRNSANHPTEEERINFICGIDNAGDALTILREIESAPSDFTKETVLTVYMVLREKFNITCI